MASYLARCNVFLTNRKHLLNIYKHRNQLKCSVRDFHLSNFLFKVVPFNLTDIGEGIHEVTIKEWFVKVGDKVEQFDNVVEVQSDKASVTISSRFDGTIVKIYYKVDEIAYVGKPLVDIDVEDEEEDDSSTSSDTSSTESEREKVIESAEALIQKYDNTPQRRKALATPAVRRIAMENKVELSKVPATGKFGRVLKGDVLEFLGKIPPGTTKPHPTLQQKEVKDIAAPSTTVGRIEPHPTLQQKVVKDTAAVATTADRIEPLKGVRKAMFKSMSESLKIPHFAYSDEVDMTNLIHFRNQLVGASKDYGVGKLTFMPFCIKAASLALRKYPILNSSLNVEEESIIYKTSHNISVAMDTPQGLVVPNVKNCQNKSIMEIAKDLNALIERSRAGNLKPEDFADGTFSLSNIGIIGGTYTHPCIMPPQVSIGAMGRTKIVPRFGSNGEIVKAHIMHVSWSADHRVIDGVTMASFSNLWKNYLENPALFLLENNSSKN